MGIPLGPINPNDPAIGVYRRLPKRASGLRFLVARIFGSRKTVREENVLVTYVVFRGSVYLLDTHYLGMGAGERS